MRDKQFVHDWKNIHPIGFNTSHLFTCCSAEQTFSRAQLFQSLNFNKGHIVFLQDLPKN